MSYTMTMKELGDTQRVRRMCVGNSDPIFVSGENGEEQMVLLDAGIFRELYARHQIHSVNLGFYGNTPWATTKLGGMALIVR